MEVNKISFWNDKKLDQPEITIIDYLEFDGTPIYVKIPDWEKIETFTFTNKKGKEFTSEYILTNKGWLNCDSVRLRRQLKQFLGSKDTLVIQRWCDGDDTRSTIYKVELEPKETSKSKPKPKPKTK